MLDGHVRILGRDEGAVFGSGGVRAHGRSLGEGDGFRFVDPTAALRAEAAAGRLPYNAVFDTHVNALGAKVIAEVMTNALRGGL